MEVFGIRMVVHDHSPQDWIVGVRWFVVTCYVLQLRSEVSLYVIIQYTAI